MKTSRERLGAFIRAARNEQTQSEAAKILGITQAHLSAIEAGKATPSTDVVDGVVENLGADKARAMALLASAKRQSANEKITREMTRAGATE